MENSSPIWHYPTSKPIFQKHCSSLDRRPQTYSLFNSDNVLLQSNQSLQNSRTYKINKNIKNDNQYHKIRLQSPHTVTSQPKQIYSFKSIQTKKQINYQKNIRQLPYSSKDFIESSYQTRKFTRKNSIVLTTRQVSSQNFEVIKVLGKGRYGNVYLVKDRQTGFIMALKAISKAIINQKKIESQIIRQIKIQFYLRHPGIVELYGIFHDLENIYLIMELGCDGQLFDLLEKRRILKQQTTSFLAKNLLNAAEYMHAQHILHRDLKPQNIVMILGHPKICDFGWSVFTNPNQEDVMRNTFCGTPLYFSPQLLLGKNYDQKVDLWAIGVMIYEFLTGKSPFSLKSQKDLEKIVTEDINYRTIDPISYYSKQFITSCLQKNPEDRAQIKQLLRFWFIRKYTKLQTCQQLCELTSIIPIKKGF